MRLLFFLLLCTKNAFAVVPPPPPSDSIVAYQVANVRNITVDKVHEEQTWLGQAAVNTPVCIASNQPSGPCNVIVHTHSLFT